MSGTTMRGPVAMGKRGMLLLGALLAAVAMYFVVMAAPASAEDFCSGVILQPYGHNGDRCTAPQGGWTYIVYVNDFERSGCETTENNGELLSSWTCFGSGGVGYSYPNPYQWSHGIIRNNNLSFTGKFSDNQYFCPNQGCA
jgi:hypothetical protein